MTPEREILISFTRGRVKAIAVQVIMGASMGQSEPKQWNEQANEAKPSPRRPYQKPEVRCERVFETMALSCGKVSATQGPCNLNRNAS